MIGSNVPCLIRAVVACGWFGIQTMFGGLAIHLFLGSILRGLEGLGGTGEVIGFMVFWTLNLWVVLRGPSRSNGWKPCPRRCWLVGGRPAMGDAERVDERTAGDPAPSRRASRCDRLLPGRADRDGRFLGHLVVEHSDFSRYAKSQKDQILGQILACR